MVPVPKNEFSKSLEAHLSGIKNNSGSFFQQYFQH